MATTQQFIFLFAGLLIGVLVLWRANRNVKKQLETAKAQTNDLQTELETTRSHTEDLQAQLGDAKSHADTLQAEIVAKSIALGKAEERASRVATLETRLAEAGDKVLELSSENSELATRLNKEREATQEKLSLLENAKDELANAFRALSAEALKNNNSSFLELAKADLGKHHESAKSDLAQRQQAINELVNPIKESLGKFDVSVKELEKERVGAYNSLTEQVKHLFDSSNHLRAETSTLVKALGRPETRGTWGEVQLKRVVEMSGMLEHCDFEEQVNVKTEEGRLRPDLIIRLPGGKNIVVDSKAIFQTYLEAVATEDANEKKIKMQRYVKDIKTHISLLSQKKYFEQFQPTPEFVVFFLPGEAFYRAALENDASLIDYGVEQKVIIASPVILIALLKTVAYGWRQESLAKNAKDISDLGRELYKRLSTMGDHITSLGKSLRGSVNHFNSMVGSLENKVMPQARRFEALKAAPENTELKQLNQIDLNARNLQVAEMVGSTNDDMQKQEIK